MENSIDSSLIKRLEPINYLFWGLLIVFIDIKIGEFDIINDTIGFIIIAYALYCLKNLSKQFSYGLYFALITLAWQVFCDVFSFSVYRGEAFSICAFFVGILTNLFMTYFILAGLEELARSQKLGKLAGGLKSAFSIYLFSMALMVISFFLTGTEATFVTYALWFFYIRFLNQIRSAYKNIDGACIEDGLAGPGALKTLVFVLLFCVLPFSAGTGVIALAEAVDVETALFDQSDLGESDQSDIRAKMIGLGFDSAVVRDMPDSEIAYYKDIVSVQKSESEELACDGGLLKITQYAVGLDGWEHRYTVYYQWISEPKFAHAEALGLMLFTQDNVSIKQDEYSSINLYDIDGDTCFSKDTNANICPENTVKKFKLIKQKGAENYRGYLAFTAEASVNPYYLTVGFYYIHQSNIFNNRGADIININDNKTGFIVENKGLFIKEYNNFANVDTGYGNEY